MSQTYDSGIHLISTVKKSMMYFRLDCKLGICSSYLMKGALTSLYAKTTIYSLL